MTLLSCFIREKKIFSVMHYTLSNSYNSMLTCVRLDCQDGLAHPDNKQRSRVYNSRTLGSSLRERTQKLIESYVRTSFVGHNPGWARLPSFNFPAKLKRNVELIIIKKKKQIIHGFLHRT
jgi:hypothetical protein